MAWAAAQAVVGNSAHAQSVAVTFGSNVTVGNLIVVGVAFETTGGNMVTVAPPVTDNLGNTYTPIVWNNPGGTAADNCGLYYTVVTTGGACTITCTCPDPPTNPYWTMAAGEYSNTGTLALDATTSNNATGTAASSGNITLAGTDLVVGIFGSVSVVGITATGSYTKQFEYAGGSFMPGAYFDQLNVSSSPANVTGTWGGSTVWIGSGAAFKATAAGSAALSGPPYPTFQSSPTQDTAKGWV